MARDFDVYGLGNAIVDLQLQISEEHLYALGFEKSTMRLVSADEQDDIIGKFQGYNIDWSSGGSVANSVIATAQLGGSAALGTLVGADGFGEFFHGEMERLAVGFHNKPSEGVRTSTSAIVITPDAERTMRTYLGASSAFDAEHVDPSYIERSEWIFCEGYLLLQDGGTRAVKKAIECAKRSGTKVALTASEAFVVQQHAELFAELSPNVDLLFCNLHEGQAITGEEAPDRVFAGLRKRFPYVSLTMHSEGAWTFANGMEARVPGYPVEAIDETGAGDMFAGAFLYGLTHGHTTEFSTQLACLLASKVVSQIGARLTGDVCELVRTSGLAI